LCAALLGQEDLGHAARSQATHHLEVTDLLRCGRERGTPPPARTSSRVTARALTRTGRTVRGAGEAQETTRARARIGARRRTGRRPGGALPVARGFLGIPGGGYLWAFLAHPAKHRSKIGRRPPPAAPPRPVTYAAHAMALVWDSGPAAGFTDKCAIKARGATH